MKLDLTSQWVIASFTMLFWYSSVSADVPDLSGIWSDPPPRAEDAFCHIGCAIEAREYLSDLLNDPANIDVSYAELKGRAMRYQLTELFPSYMTVQALESRANRKPPPPSSACEPWGLVRTSMAPHAMRLAQYDDRVILLYSEWTVSRYVYLDGRKPPSDLKPSKYGFSVGHYEGQNLVVTTTGITADNFGQGGFTHSDQVVVTERFTRVNQDRLEVQVTITDPLTYTQPVQMARAWSWSPEEEIYPYDKCVIPE